MQPVTRYFKRAVYSSKRRATARVRFEILDIEAVTDNTKAVTSEAIISRTGQLTNKVRRMSAKYATFEKDYWKLDGNHVLPVTPSEEQDAELGWWSGGLCDGGGMFNPNQVLGFTFGEEHSSMGLTIYFDILNKEYATEFDITVFDALDNVIVSESVVDNAEPIYVWIRRLTNYARIEIAVKKWCKPYRRVKVVEVDFGVIEEYDDASLIKLRTLQEVSPISNTLPANEVMFTINNSDRRFNVLNPRGFYEYLQHGQECFVDIGITLPDGSVEFIHYGKYFLYEWQSDEGTMTATFTARDAFNLLSGDEVENKEERQKTLYDLAVEVMAASGIEEYNISGNLSLIPTTGIHDKVSYRELLRLIVQAGMSVAYTDHLGVLHIKQVISVPDVISGIEVSDEALISNKEQVVNFISEPSLNIATFEKDRFRLDGGFGLPAQDMSEYEIGWWSSALCGEAGDFTTPPCLTVFAAKDHTSRNLEIIFDSLNGEYASEFVLRAYGPDNAITINDTILCNSARLFYENNLLENARRIEIIINKWSAGYRRARIIELGFDLPVDSITLDNAYTEPQIALKENVKRVEVSYYEVQYEGDDEFPTLNEYLVVAEDPNIKKGDVIQVKNTLINTEGHALKVAKWVLEETNNRGTFTVDWRGNPAHEVTDKISIENGYWTRNTANIIKQELDYQGALSGITTAKGVV